ncbi:MAG: cytochrome C oxidase subunit IV family protein [Phycisphaerae bacterium]|nr:cytochrome C oxidase subunit IV family protein [Phycisphaerae bacterium]NUQ45152.1 cytochrome C oxidase subunit IV family protein [Phycisphaerae bacterium]
MSFATPEDARKHRNIYLAVLVALAVLTGVTVLVAQMHFLSTPMAVAVALLVACIKGGLVASFFMHLISEKTTLYGILVICVVFFFVLLLLPLATEFTNVST